MDMIKSADYVIDLGPEGGAEGGEVVGAGRPEDIARLPHSHTGTYLKKALEENRNFLLRSGARGKRQDESMASPRLSFK